MKRMWKMLWPWLLDIAVMVLAGWLMLGCSAKKAVTRDSVRAVHDTVYVQRGHNDSVRTVTVTRDSVRVLLRDSIVIVRDTAGKVVERYEWHYGDRVSDKNVGSDKTRIKTDTLVVYKDRTDTAYVTRTITAQPTKRKSNWLMVVLGVLTLIIAGGAWLKLKKN